MSEIISFPDDWVITGWGKDPNGRWIELGHSVSIKINTPEIEPELKIHEVADKLNELYDKIQRMYWEYQKLIADKK